MGEDWVAWHESYDRESSLRRRLEVVQAQVARALDARPPGPIKVIGLCAGQGRDLLPVVASHPRRDDVHARLVELDPRNVELAKASAEAFRLTQIEIVAGDASLTSVYAGAVPADIVLTCGVFGNVSDEDIAYTIEQLPTLCSSGATVVWTRGAGKGSDLRPAVRRWFGEAGFEELFFRGEPESFGVGVHRLAVEPRAFDPGLKLFIFVR